MIWARETEQRPKVRVTDDDTKHEENCEAGDGEEEKSDEIKVK